MSSDPFDEKAATWDSDPGHVERAKAVAACIEREITLDRSMRTLEYGAGTGLVSESLQSKVGALTLADTSAGMRDVIRSKVEAGRLPSVEIWDMDVAGFDVDGGIVPDEKFDLIVTVLTLHHISDLAAALAGFTRLLNPQGRLCIVDLDEEDGSFHGEGFGGHHGFDRVELTQSLASVGFGTVTTADCHTLVRDGGNYPMFIAVATN